MPAGNPSLRGAPQSNGVRSQIFTCRAIGQVESANGNDIVLQPELAAGLDGIAPGDRLMVIFVFDRAGDCELRQHPRGDLRRARRGVFALHSPRRPNPIGVTAVEVLEIAKNVVRIRGLDAWPGTPVLDLKLDVKGER